MIALLRTRRWLGYLAVTVVFAAVCCALGAWQWNRREEALAAIARLDANYDAPPRPIDEVLHAPAAYDIEQQWAQVALQGEYLSDEQVLMRGRVRDGQVGFDVVVPFVLSDGSVMIVDRGWLPPGSTPDRPDSVAPPPTGSLSIVVRLRGDEGAIAGRGAPAGQIASVDLEAFDAALDAPLYTGAYGLLATEDGNAPTDVQPAIRPVLDEGPHLSYCLQWFVFALLGFIGFGWALRREARTLAGMAPTARRSADAEEEDALVDAASGRPE